MTRVLGFVAGLVVGHWLAVGAAPPRIADVSAWAARALERAAARPAPPVPVPPSGGPRDVRLVSGDVEVQLRDGDAVAVPLESALGVWVVEASLNGGAPARFLVDTGSSVVIVAPRVAAAVGITAAPHAPRIELHTVAGRSAGPTTRVRSLRVGALELVDVPIVLHDPGPGFDGILGNAFLRQYRLTLDPDRHLLLLRPLGPGPTLDVRLSAGIGPPPPAHHAPPPGRRRE
jgi:clan AA aspartic protease (TIGR02281 family)